MLKVEIGGLMHNYVKCSKCGMLANGCNRLSENLWNVEEPGFVMRNKYRVRLESDDLWTQSYENKSTFISVIFLHISQQISVC